jgi:hypothetical protein
MLTLTGKPRRDKVRDKFLVQLEEAYAELAGSNEGASQEQGRNQGEDLQNMAYQGVALSLPDDVFSSSVDVSAPAGSVISASQQHDNNAAKDYESKVSMAADITSLAVEDSEESRTAAHVSFLSASWAMASMEGVELRLPAVFEATVSLPQPLVRKILYRLCNI